MSLTTEVHEPTQNQKDRELYLSRILQLLSTVYGPYAFGIASLMLIWFTIVGPQLDRQAIDFEKNQQAVDSLKQVANSMEAISRSMERTATVLESVVEQVNR